VTSLLDTFPASRRVEFRTPRIIRDHVIIGTDKAALPDSDKFSATRRLARAGFNNDCFLASTDDQGTYEDTAEDYPFLRQQTKWTITGGETCAVSSRSNCATAKDELAYFHYTHLNPGYNQQVLNSWGTACLDEIGNRLGYRIVLTQASLNTNVIKKSSTTAVTLTLKLFNRGYAAPVRKLKPAIVLKSTTTSQVVTGLVATWDSRNWLPESGTLTLSFSFTPASSAPISQLVVGQSYALKLRLCDFATTNSPLDTRFCVRTSNVNGYDTTNGWNHLQLTVSVQA
jgi:hypothetical protein